MKKIGFPGTFTGRIVIYEQEGQPHQISTILVKEKLGYWYLLTAKGSIRIPTFPRCVPSVLTGDYGPLRYLCRTHQEAVLPEGAT